MAIHRTIDGDELTLTIEYTANITKASNTLERAAKSMYGDDNKFDTLSNSEKLAIIDDAVKSYILSSANRQYIEDAEKVAESNVSDEHSL